MNKRVAIRQILLLGCTAFIVSSEAASVDSLDRISDTLLNNVQIRITGLTPLFDLPVKGALPQRYAETDQVFKIDSAFTDSAGAQWYCVTRNNQKNWLLSSSVQRIQQGTTGSTIEKSTPVRTDADQKRRLHIVLQHNEWPRRIQNVVREGKVCLGMTHEQLTASWGEPVQRDNSFISDHVKFQLWIYKGKNGQLLTVNLMNGKVCGWSM